MKQGKAGGWCYTEPMSTSRRSLLLLALCFTSLLGACNALGGAGTAAENAVPTATAETITDETVAAEEVSTPEPAPAIPPSQLRLWVPPEIGSRTPGAADVLTAQLRDFNAQHPEIELVVEQKPVEGPGGIMAYLDAGGEVAPGILPDLVALPNAILDDASLREMLVPVDGLVPPGAIAELFSAAETQVRHDGLFYGVPFALTGLAHLASTPVETSQGMALDWTQFISVPDNTLTLPVDSRDGALFGLEFYLASDGRLTNDAGQPLLEVDVLEQALDQIRLGRPNLGQSFQLKSLDEAWQSYEAGLSSHVWTRSEFQQALIAGGGLPGTQANAPVPGPDGPLTPLVSGWSWAVSSDDPDRQRLSGELIAFLTEPSNLQGWVAGSQTLPARRDVANSLAQEQPYYAFAARELERAVAMPAAAGNRMLEVLGFAVYETLAGEKPTRQIAEEAVLALQQP